ncbi:membrane protein [Salmonella enterica subsp. enterica serovar Newport str. CVM22443]|uniref:StfD n=7 Tax=Salmonella enterica TaxID=28901 RepID=I7CMR3_SALNE|nr:conserved hypothetical protein [Salmonella enterica subsp. enterica serovar Newport str. SL254]AFO55253.1 StfD [Salmonella enterica subsp. enterica serovar Newport]AGS28169.1 protein yadU [Salmonella enterica subsp. enterica serovar Newport str. USMARC-S3124.1]AIT46266.1 membrane protein [Salmonella enterica subsp. enterica serovar Newport str. CVM N18486]AJB00858.1 membrane protein [Salmonella enterica subsp. enterica serovar Newport str. CVM N1543]AJB07163.1 membrane protein [Salmonella e
MMKIIRTLFLLLIAVYGSSVVAKPMLKATFGSTTLYYGIGPSYADRAVILNSTVTTPDGVYYGSWKFSGMARKGATATLLSWTGPDPAPTIVLRDFDNSISKSNCKNLPSSWNGCGYYTVDITVQSDNYGCPWLAATHSTAEDLVSGETYSAPDTRSSVCPKIPVDTFDISWDANVSKQKTTLMLDATGGTVNRTLHTYLMEGGKLCDGSKFDNRGAYCRFVSSGITLNVLGCDQSSVTTSAVDHPITDVELHDINVAVNTRNIGSGQFTSTCSFQYIIDEI